MDFSLMKDFMDRLTAWRIPGNSISICVENKEVFNYQSGFEDVENKIKMSGDKLFNIFSCSKPITVTAALQLYERGYFLLDDPLYEFIPEYKNMFYRDAEGNIEKCEKPITLRNLFTMTSGFTYNTRSDAFKKARELTDGKMDTLVCAKCVAEDPLAFIPGTHWGYSISHDVLGAVVEVISGMKFRDYVKKNIFEPLEMNESYYHNEGVIDRVAEMYRYVNSTETNLVKLQSAADNSIAGHIEKVDKRPTAILGTEYDSGGAGITTSVSDYSKFASALANGGIGMNGEQIISSGTIDLMRTNQLSPELLPDLSWSQLKGYGYGLGVRTLIDKAKSGTCGNIGEFGWGGAAGATVLVDPELKLSVFYTHHMLNPQEEYYQPRLRNVVYTCMGRK